MTTQEYKNREQDKAVDSGISLAVFDDWWKEFSADAQHLSEHVRLATEVEECEKRGHGVLYAERAGLAGGAQWTRLWCRDCGELVRSE